MYIRPYPPEQDNLIYEFVVKTINDALIYDAINNPEGLQWLDIVLPVAVPGADGLISYTGVVDYVAAMPNDNVRAMLYAIPQEPLTPVAAQGWQFNLDLVCFANLERIIKTVARQGRYQAVLMREMKEVIDKRVWGFDKRLINAFLTTPSEIFAELGQDQSAALAPFAAFRIGYEITISEGCVTRIIPDIEACI